MKWFRNTFLWASVGCLGASGSVSAQQANWRPAVVPLTSEYVAQQPAVGLGRPTPLAPESIRVANAFAPIERHPGAGAPKRHQQTPPTVVRGARPIQEDEPRNPFMLRELPPLDELRQPSPVLPLLHTTPAQTGQPAPSQKMPILHLDKDGKITPAPEKIGPPKLSVPAIPSDEWVIILDNGSPRGEDDGQALFGMNDEGSQRFYARGEWLLWTARGFRVPPLVLTASPNTPLAIRGILGVDPTARVIFGDENLAGGLRSGARFTAGYELDPCGFCTLEGNFFFLSRRNHNANFDSSQFPVIGRPFIDADTGLPDRELTTSPDQFPIPIFAATGSLQVDSSSTLFGAEANLRSLLWVGCQYKVTGLIGYRYLDLSDRLSITEKTLLLRGIPAPANSPDIFPRAGDLVTTTDRFDTRNRFHGGQIGGTVEWQRDRWTLEAKLKLGIGATYQSVDIDGSQRDVGPDGRRLNFVGGLLALPSNIGHHSQTRFGFVPEVGVKLGYQLTEQVHVFAGYDFLYWSSVLRPGDQIDPVIDLNLVPRSGRTSVVPNQLRPSVPFRTSSYWAHGLNAGLEFRY